MIITLKKVEHYTLAVKETPIMYILPFSKETKLTMVLVELLIGSLLQEHLLILNLTATMLIMVEEYTSEDMLLKVELIIVISLETMLNTAVELLSATLLQCI